MFGNIFIVAKKILFFGLYIILLLLLCEYFLRFTWKREVAANSIPYLHIPEPINGYTLMPTFYQNVDTPRGQVEYTISSQGLRANREFGVDDDESLIRIFAIGDSFTFGPNVNLEETYEYKLENELNKSPLNEGQKYEVLNLGVMGYGTKNAINQLYKYAHRFGVPQMVIYTFCSNDPMENIQKPHQVVDGTLLSADVKNTKLASLLAKLYFHSKIFSLILDSSFGYRTWYETRLAKLNNLRGETNDIFQRDDFKETMRNISELDNWTKRRGVQLLVLEANESEYGYGLKKYLENKKIPLLPYTQTLSKYSNAKFGFDILFEDQHWNHNGHRIIATSVFQYLKTKCKSVWSDRAKKNLIQCSEK